MTKCAGTGSVNEKRNLTLTKWSDNDADHAEAYFKAFEFAMAMYV